MVKIARGTSAQADVLYSPFCGDTASGYSDGSVPGWSIRSQASLYPAVSTDFETAGWDMTLSGTITVPPDAASGTYIAWYMTAMGSCFDEEHWPGHDALVMHYSYEFEVVCMKVSITGLF